jgi:RND family efflux transporter MFP subunit
MKNMKNIEILTIIFLIFTLSGCGEKKDTVEEVAEVPKIVVRTQTPLVGTITEWHGTTAELRAPLEADLSFMANGRILELAVDDGAYVTAGQYLGKVDTSTLAAQFNAAKSSEESARSMAIAADIAADAVTTQVDLARASFEQAQRDFDRMQALHEDNVATQAEFERAQLSLESAELGLRQAEESTDAARAQAEAAWSGVDAAADQALQFAELIGDGTLRAPFSGYITSRMADPGMVTAAGIPVYKLIASGEGLYENLEIHFDLPEAIIGHISVGMSVYVNFQSCDEEISATITRIGREIDTESRTVEIICLLDNGTGCLMPGMFGSVRIPLIIHDNAILLPEEAVIELENENIVFIADGDTARRVTVTTGLVEDGTIEILDGLTHEDAVIVVGNRYLSDGAGIRIMNGNSSSVDSGNAPESGQESED